MPEDVRAVRRRVGKQVQRLRRSRGFSQERLAELVGNTSNHIGQVERGEVNVGIDILASIARVLAVDLPDLFVPVAGRRRRGSPLFLVNRRQLELLEEVARRIRAAPMSSSDNADD